MLLFITAILFDIIGDAAELYPYAVDNYKYAYFIASVLSLLSEEKFFHYASYVGYIGFNLCPNSYTAAMSMAILCMISIFISHYLCKINDKYTIAAVILICAGIFIFNFPRRVPDIYRFIAKLLNTAIFINLSINLGQ